MNNIYTIYDQVTGNVKNGFVAQFIPGVAGLHVVLVEYNGVAVGGTPFYCKVTVYAVKIFYQLKIFLSSKIIFTRKIISSTKNILKKNILTKIFHYQKLF